MQILVTGGTGYVGKHIVERLSRKHRVFVISRQRPSSVNNPATYIQCDITNTVDLVKKTGGLGFDCVIHLAAYHPKNPFESPQTSMRINVGGTQSLVNYCAITNIKHLVFSSTFSIYGTGQNKPISEDFLANPINPYALSKYFAERILYLANQQTGINVTIFRFSGIFGADRKDGAVYNFVSSALAGETITVSNPLNFTDMVYIDDIFDVIKKSLKIGGFEIFNISSGEKYTVIELAKICLATTKSSSAIEIKPPNLHETLQLNLNIEKAKSLLGFRPTPLYAGIAKVIKSLR